jgi:hypothetical protein
MGDRAFAFVRTPGPKGFPWHTGREQEDLVLFRPHFRKGSAAILPPDIEETFKMGNHLAGRALMYTHAPGRAREIIEEFGAVRR